MVYFFFVNLRHFHEYAYIGRFYATPWCQSIFNKYLNGFKYVAVLMGNKLLTECRCSCLSFGFSFVVYLAQLLFSKGFVASFQFEFFKVQWVLILHFSVSFYSLFVRLKSEHNAIITNVRFETRPTKSQPQLNLRINANLCLVKAGCSLGFYPQNLCYPEKTFCQFKQSMIAIRISIRFSKKRRFIKYLLLFL